jgi:hypothetical protein
LGFGFCAKGTPVGESGIKRFFSPKQWDKDRKHQDPNFIPSGRASQCSVLAYIELGLKKIT